MKASLIAIAAGLCLGLPACSTLPAGGLQSSSDTVEQAILSVLTQQAEAWNDGDIDAFMNGYWPSPQLRFASGGTVTRGYQETLERYKARYAGRDAMGMLTFSQLETVILSEDAAVVHGHWRLERDADTPSGLFTLVFRRLDGSWKIVSDPTTSAG